MSRRSVVGVAVDAALSAALVAPDAADLRVDFGAVVEASGSISSLSVAAARCAVVIVPNETLAQGHWSRFDPDAARDQVLLVDRYWGPVR